LIRAVAGVAIDQQRVLLLRKRGQGVWFFPGGKFEDGESEQDCLARE